MEVPAEVLTAAAELVAEYGPSFLRLGERGGVTYFSFSFPDGLPMGFPIVYTYEKREKVRGNNGGRLLWTWSAHSSDSLPIR